MRRVICMALSVVGLIAPGGHGQDSIGFNACLPGDALSPWSTTEQRTQYVVDLAPFAGSWGTEFGIAPIIKSSKSSTGFFASLTSAQSISRGQSIQIPLSSEYALWNQPGSGIHPTNNGPPSSFIDLSGRQGNRFAVALTEFATTDAGRNYNAVIGGLIQYEPTDPSRLYVDRIVAALNGCDGTANVSQFGLGAVDQYGHIHIRADGFGVTGGCGLVNLTGNNYFRIAMDARNAAALNVISGDFPGGDFDAAAVDWMVRNSGVTHNTPNILPDESLPLVLGTNFNDAYVRGQDFPGITSDLTHLAPGVTSQRGNISYSPHNCAALSSVAGIGAVIGRESDELANELNVFGLDPAGTVTGSLALSLPAVIADPTTGATNIAGDNEFDHYHSQVFSRGGNGQIALGRDAAGNLLVAAQVDHPVDGGPDWPVNYIAVARMDCDTGTVDWTMAGYNDGTIGLAGTGKPILDGVGGSVIGRMVTLNNVTGGAPFGPSVSAPMIDAGGNVWFLSAVELFDGMGGSTFNNALLRAVYDPVSFSYQLELIFKLGDQFAGPNSGRDYLISFMAIADSNSVDSGTAWSQNISAFGHGGVLSPDLDPQDSRNLGGIIIAARIVYDADNDGDFEIPCDGTEGNRDQDYNVVLYVGSIEPIETGAPPPIAPNPDGLNRARFITMQIPPNVVATGVKTAIQVDLTSIDTPPGAPAGSQTRWVNAVGFNGSNPGANSIECGDAPAHCPNFACAVLGCEPEFRDWSAEVAAIDPVNSVIHVTGDAVVPSSSYTVTHVGDGSAASLSAQFITGTWGDVVPAFGVVNVTDLSAVKDWLVELIGAPCKSRVWMRSPANPFSDANVLDLSNVANVLAGVSEYSGPAISACP